jgi:hypothetical protein
MDTYSHAKELTVFVCIEGSSEVLDAISHNRVHTSCGIQHSYGHKTKTASFRILPTSELQTLLLLLQKCCNMCKA